MQVNDKCDNEMRYFLKNDPVCSQLSEKILSYPKNLIATIGLNTLLKTPNYILRNVPYVIDIPNVSEEMDYIPITNTKGKQINVKIRDLILQCSKNAAKDSKSYCNFKDIKNSRKALISEKQARKLANYSVKGKKYIEINNKIMKHFEPGEPLKKKPKAQRYEDIDNEIADETLRLIMNNPK